MKYWSGYVTAAVFGAITWALMNIGARFTELVDMVYPYVMRTMQTMLAEWSGSVDFVLWQVLLVVLAVLALASVVLMIVLKWNPVQWVGWVLAAVSIVFMLHTLTYGLNFYAGPIAEDIRLEVVDYNTEELAEAAIYYRDKANELASQVNRDAGGNVDFADFDTLAQQAGEGFTALTYDYSYPIFAGCKEPVKELSWADWYTSQGITGVTVGLTGEAAVNPQIPDICLPFTMCHEMAHRMCIATEIDGDFAAFLACQANENVEFRYSGYFMAYYYCYNALVHSNSMEGSAAAARVNDGVSSQLYQDITNYTKFFNIPALADAPAARMTAEAQATDGMLVTVKDYDNVSDLLVAWHIQTVVIPSISVDERAFDPMDENQVDLTGIVNAVLGEG